MSEPASLEKEIPCHACGYDVRAQPADGICPECGASVAESRRLAPVPRRPAWRDSDPRWRRRMLAGVWILTLVPLMSALLTFGWASDIPVPTFFKVQGSQSLAGSFLPLSYACFTFCIGIVLLFAKERNRQPHRLDWTRRWGIITSYLVLFLGIPTFAFITALVAIGIAALFLSMRAVDQPPFTGFLTHLGTAFIYYGPNPGPLLYLSLVVFSSAAVLLACVPLYNALRSSGPKELALILLAPLVIGSLVQFAYVAQYSVNPASAPTSTLGYFYFAPNVLLSRFTYRGGNPFVVGRASATPLEFIIECTKWFAILAIAIWLTIAQIAAMLGHRKTGEMSTTEAARSSR
jgi:hypothetical protein